MEITVFKEIAKWMGKKEDFLKLLRLEELEEEKRFFVTFWGHYSAGKSRLINSILGKEVLPVQSRETTALLTYIQYGTEEICRIIYNNGTYSDEDINTVKDIFQNAQCERDLEAIDHLEVFVDNELLKDGLVLVDTPGVNTLIQRHQDLATDAIEQSGKIVYVLGNSPTKVDIEFVEQINRCGIDIFFVRTKADRINQEEENTEEALQQEKIELQEMLEKDIEFIPVSNELDNEWNKNIQVVKSVLLEIAHSISEEMKVALDMRLHIYAEKYLKDLTEVCSEIENTIAGNNKLLDEKISKYNRDVERLEEIADGLEKKVENKINDSKKFIREDIEQLIKHTVNEFSKSLKTIEGSTEYDKIVSDKYREYLRNSIGEVQSIINGYFETIIEEENASVENVLENTLELVEKRESPKYEEVRLENSRTLELYKSQLAEVKEELEKLKTEKKNTVEKRQAMESSEEYNDELYQEELEKLKTELDSVSTEIIMREVEPDGMQPSKIFKKVGQVTDMALLLLPGDAIVAGVKGAVDAGKVAKNLNKMGKFGEVVLKTGSKLSKSKSVINSVDTVRDTAYVANSLLNSVKEKGTSLRQKRQAKKIVNKVAEQAGASYDNFKEKKKFGNVLDALSVAYWTEKIGAKFDTPPRMEVDVEREKERLRKRDEITQKQNDISAERMKKKKEMGLITSKEKELEMEETEKKRVLNEVQSEIEKETKNIEVAATKEAQKIFAQKYTGYLEGNLQAAASMIAENYYETAKQNIVIYIANHNAELLNAIQEKKNNLEDLKNLRENESGELENRFNQGKQFIQMIEEL